MFPFFAAGVGIIAITQQSSLITVLAAWVYLGARILYVPAYALGWQPWRSYIWILALLCCAVLFIAALV